MSIQELAPRDVWQYFYQITQIPRPSHQEEKIQQYILDEAARLGLQYMATIGLSGKPKVHPAQYMTLRDRNDFAKPEEFSL